MNDDLISRAEAIDALDGKIEITGRTNAEAVKGYVRLVKDRLERLPSAQPEQLTDAEQRIFLKAIEREEKVCKKVDEECGINLVHACHEIIRKVKGALWT